MLLNWSKVMTIALVFLSLSK